MVSQRSVFFVMAGKSVEDVFARRPYVMTQAASLSKTGWETKYAIFQNRSSPRMLAEDVARFRSDIRENQKCVVHAQYGSGTAALAKLAHGKAPLVISFCGDDLLGTPNPGLSWRARERAARWLGFWAAWDADSIIVKSTNLLDVLPTNLRKRAVLLPNGVDTEFFSPMDPVECRKTLGWSLEDKIVFFNASLKRENPRKNPKLATAAVEIARRAIPKIRMEAVSDVPRDRIRLMLNAADCLLVTSLHEGSPNIVKEAMACNLPVVSVRCGDVEERLSNVEPSAVCPYDASRLAEELVAILRQGNRSNGRETLFASHLNMEATAHRLSEIYEHLV